MIEKTYLKNLVGHTQNGKINIRVLIIISERSAYRVETNP